MFLVQAQDRAQFDKLRSQAAFLLKAGRYKETIELAQQAITLFPEDPRPYVQVAYALARQKRPEASEWALKAIAKEPENVAWRTALSDTFTLQSKWKKALKPMSEAVAMTPTNPRLQSMLGLILIHCRKPREALSHLQRSLELDPTNALTHQRMSLAYNRLFKRKLADEHLRKALELQPENPQIQNTLGWRMLNRGHKDEAEEAFSEALRLDPGLAGAKLGLGEPAGMRKSSTDIILRAALRLYSLPYRIILAPIHLVLLVSLPIYFLALDGTWLVKGIELAITIWSTCYIFSFIVVRAFGKRRGTQFV